MVQYVSGTITGNLSMQCLLYGVGLGAGAVPVSGDPLFFPMELSSHWSLLAVVAVAFSPVSLAVLYRLIW